MQTGKFLGIGATLSAGLLAAHVASASTLTLEEFAAGGTGSATYGKTTLNSVGSGQYSAGSGSYGSGFVNWSSITATVTRTATGASLELTIGGLNDTFSEWGFIVSDTSLGAIGSGAKLMTSGSYSVANLGSSPAEESFGAVGYVDPADNFLGVPGSAGLSSNVTVSRSAVSATSASFSYGGSGGASATASPIPTTSEYSLSTEGIVNATGVNGGAYNVSFTTTLSASAPSAVTLPGSGPLTIVGGLVVVGGLAVRRRMKV